MAPNEKSSHLGRKGIIFVIVAVAVILSIGTVFPGERKPEITMAMVQAWVDALPVDATREQVIAALTPHGFECQGEAGRLDGTFRNVGHEMLYSDDIDVHITFKENGQIGERLVVPMHRGP